MAQGERFDVGKLFRGFNIFNGSALGTIIHQAVIVIAILALIGGLWYKLFGQRTVGEETSQQAENITNVDSTAKDKFNILKVKFFGIGN